MKQKIEPFLKERLSAYLSILERMVSINSFTANAAGVRRLGTMTAEIFAQLGFEAEYVPSAHPEYAPHVVLTRRGTGSAVLGLVSHLDTVFSEDEERANDFRFRIAGDRVYGPGTIDIKGGTAMIYAVLDAIKACAREVWDAVTWVVLLSASEETESRDFGQLCLKRLPAAQTKAALVFEAGKLKNGKHFLVGGRKGRAVYRIAVAGKSAHSGSEHPAGANAILQLSQLVPQLEALTDYQRELTVNVGLISGGSCINRVPHAAELEGELRAHDTAVFEEVVEKIKGLASAATVVSADSSYRCHIAVTISEAVSPWPENDRSRRLYEIWQNQAAASGTAPGCERRGGLSDANYFWHALPTLDGLGPAGANDHCSVRSADGTLDQEYLLLPAFLPKAVWNTLAILELVRGDE